jgi:hypothetical protein
LSDADEFDGGGGTAGAFLDGLMRYGDRMNALKDRGATGFRLGNLAVAPFFRWLLCRLSLGPRLIDGFRERGR